ncbi:response regulator transcription factor family protein [Ktedonosporobacter rubrisoli]|uniref:Response regulator transcription factor family protein n=1 Tax=Ktedonosporobacter rubrisoli TaxID=2509675 RepID=A0A4V0YZP1_KTERU|nr:response regulator transcription factor family protein [Ktedonosporobacter rubrisoli]QBD80401.1 response regulator transcription factor family protein [Ktedonosporobacter rubrisoli]
MQQIKDASSTSSNERLLQILSTGMIQLNALQALVDKPQAEEPVDRQRISEGLRVLEQITREALSLVRSANDELPLTELAGITLAEALTRLVEETAEELSLSSRISLSGADEQGESREQQFAPASARLLYLIAREALYQVRQHAGARRLRLTLAYGPDDVQMTIEDDGLNIASSIVEEHAPLWSAPDEDSPGENESAAVYNLRKRLEQMGGTLEIASSEARGTRVMARLPYELPALESGAAEANTVNSEAALIPLNQQLRILVVDSLAVNRAGLHHLLETYPGLLVVGEAADGVQAVSETLELGPQVVLMDAQLPERQSLEATQRIKQLNLDTRVLLLSSQEREEYLYELLRSGADGYILKDIAPDELVQAIRTVARGEILIQPQIASKLLSRIGRQNRGASYETLTARELDVLRLLARGLRNKDIAAQLYVSERTVNFHLANIYQKLNVSGRTEALSKALEQGLISV